MLSLQRSQNLNPYLTLSNTTAQLTQPKIPLQYRNAKQNYKNSGENDDSETTSNKLKRSIAQPLILLIEDDLIIQKVHRAYLEALNCKVVIAANGQDALVHYQNNPDLIFLDIGLPDMDGLAICHAIRQQEKNHHVPIIVLTSFGDVVAEECRSVGADDYATKPISMENLKDLLHHWLPKYNSIIPDIKKSNRQKEK